MKNNLYIEGIHYLTAREAGDVLGYAPDYVSRLCREGKLRGRRSGKSWIVEADSLIPFIKAHEAKKEARHQDLSRELKAVGERVESRDSDFVPLPRLQVAPRHLHILRASEKAHFAREAAQTRMITRISITTFAAVLLLFVANTSVVSTHIANAVRGTDANDAQVAAVSFFSPIEAIARGTYTGLTSLACSVTGWCDDVQPMPVVFVRGTAQQPIAQAPAPTNITNNITNYIQPTVGSGSALASGISERLLDSRLNDLENYLNGRIDLVAYEGQRQTEDLADDFASGIGGGGFDDIDITDSSFSGGSISGSALSNITFSGESSFPALVATDATTTNLYIDGSFGFGSGTGLLHTTNGTASTLSNGSNGQVLKMVGGNLAWSTDLTGGGGGGASFFASTTDDLAIYPADPSQVVIIGESATTTVGNILEIAGSSLFRGAMTSYGAVTAPRFTATSSVASVFPYASTTAISTNSLCLSGDCRQAWTADSAFSTTSADYWQTQRNFFSTTSADYYKSVNDFFSTTSVDYWKTANNFFSTTSANAWKLTQDFFSTSSASYFLSQQGSLGFSTTSSDYWLTQRNFFSTSSANYWSSLGLGFSTSSADAWKDQRNFFSTTSAAYFLSQNQGNAFSTTSANYFAASSTTLPKTYTANTFTALQTFGNASTSVLSANTICLSTDCRTSWPTFTDTSFSTTSADYWKTQRDFFSTTSAAYFSSIGLAWSTTSANYFLSQNQGAAFSTTSAQYFLSTQGSLGFSTTSNDYWMGQRNFFSTTSAAYFLSQNLGAAFSTTSANYFVSSSTTLPKTYTANTFTALQTFGNASSSIFSANTICLSTDCRTSWPTFTDTSFSTSSADYWKTQNNFYSTTSADAWKDARNFFSTSSAAYFSSVGLAFSTTSNDYWKSVNNFFSTSSADYYKSVSNFFSTTSADAWRLTRDFFSTTSASYFLSQNQGTAFSSTSASYFLSQNGALGFSTTSANYFAASSTTLPKTYAANTFTALQTFGNASSSIFSANTICLSTDCRTSWPVAGSSFEYPFFGTGNSTSTLTQFNGGLTAYASSTIGNGTAAGGLTVDGTATTSRLVVSGTGTSTFAGDILMGGNIIPSLDNTYSLGSESRMWKDVYIGPGSLYVNGKKVIEDVSNTITISTDNDQNLMSETSGVGNNTMRATGSGNMNLLSGSGNINVTSTAGNINIGTSGSGQLNLGIVASGTWQGMAIADNYLVKSGNWTGTLDGYEASQLLGGGFSTSSADYWKTQRDFFSTTSASYFLAQNQGAAFSTTSAQYFLSQNGALGFSTTSNDYWMSQRNFFSTTSADAWKDQRNFFSTTSASYFASVGLAFSTTSNDYWKSVNNFFSTSSADYYKSTNNFFSTTSADAWKLARDFFSTTSASYFLSQNQSLGFSTTSANYFVSSSTTLPKTYTANTFTALQTFGNASTSVLSANTICLSTDCRTSWPTFTDTSFSTTSADYWQTQRNFFSTTSADYWGSTKGYATFGYLFPNNATSTLLTFNGGITAYASSTVGGGTQTTGLTISGGATTTGFLTVQGIGTSTFARGINLSAGCFSIAGTCIGGGGGTPGGSDTQVQFNNSGAFGGSAGFTFNSALSRLTVSNASTTALSITGGLLDFSSAAATTTVINNHPFAWTIATSTTGKPLFSINTTAGSEGVTIGSPSGTGDATFQFAEDTNAWSMGFSATDKSFRIASSTDLDTDVAFVLTKNASVGIGSTTPGSLLSIGDTNGINFSTATSTFSSTGGIDLRNGGCFAVNGTCIGGSGGGFSTTSADYWKTQRDFFSTTSASYFSSIGLAWSTTSANYYLSQNGALGFSTTSNDYWMTQRNFFSTTSTNYWKSVNDFFSTTSAMYFTHSSTTIPKTYTTNTFTALQNFANASSTLFSASYASTTALFANTASTSNLTISALQNGLLKVNASGVVSLAVAGTDYQTFGYLFPNNATSTLLAFNGGLTAYASSTIGGGTQTTGLTISGGATTTGNAYFAGNVGINVTNPSDRLEVEGNINIRDGYLTFQNQGYGVFGLATPSLLFYNDSIRFIKNGKDLMRVTDTGNVGVGTTTPLGKLSIHANSNDTNLVLFAVGSSTASATTTLFSISNTGSTTASNGFNITAGCYAVNGTCITGAGGASFEYPFSLTGNATSTLTQFNGGLTAYASTTIGGGSTTTGLTISGGATTTGYAYFGGNVGIRMSPQYPLDVSGIVRLGGGTIHDVSHVGISYSSPGSWYTSEYNSGRGAGNALASEFAFWNSNTEIADFQVYTGSGGVNTGAFVFNTRNGSGLAERMRLDMDGNLGIGTTSPGSKLSVAGNMFITGNIISTSTTASQLLFASTTALSATTLCLTSDSCIASWPTGGGAAYPFPLTGNATSTLTQFNGGLTAYASSTIGGGAQTTGLTISGGATTTGNAYFASNVGIGTTSPGAKLDVQDGNILTNKSAHFGVVDNARYNDTSGDGGITLSASGDYSSNGTTFQISKNASSAWSNMYLNLIDPEAAYTDAGNRLISFYYDGVSKWSLSGDSSDNFFISRQGGSGSLIVPAGNVGIGTTTPWAKLAIQGDAGQTNPIFEIASSSSATKFLSVAGDGFGTTTLSGLNISGSATSTSNVGMNITSGCYAVGGVCLSGGASLSGTTGQLAYFSGTNTAVGTSSLFISTTGSVGVGTTTPTAKFNVWGDMEIGSGSTANLRAYNASRSANGFLTLYDGSTGNVTLGTTFSSGDVILTPGTSGNVGIGTSTPWANLSINSTAGVPQFVIGSSTATQFLVDMNGNVGIGTTSPAALLHVMNGLNTDSVIFGSNTHPTVASPLLDVSNAQFRLGGGFIGGTYNAPSGTSSAKLLISNYDNDGTTIYPILALDENGGVDFFLKNRPSVSGNSIAYFQGNVGIGTTTPDGAMVHIETPGDGSVGSPHLRLTESGDAREASIYNRNGGLYLITHGTDNVADEALTLDSGIATIYTGGSERFRISSGGFVGIGNTNPGSLLDVGVTGGTSNTGLTGNTFLREYSTTNTAFLSGYDGTGAGDIALQFRTQNAGSLTNGLYISAAGDVGIGNASPGKKLEVTGAMFASSHVFAGQDSTTNPAVSNVIGSILRSDGYVISNSTGNPSGFFGRQEDGAIINFYSAGATEGNISISGTAVSYNAFTGSHYGTTDEEVERGMLVELDGTQTFKYGTSDSEPTYGFRKTTGANSPAVFGSFLALMEPQQPHDPIENPYLVMAVGNGDMWVVQGDEESIEPGDYLISSNLAGHAMKDPGTYMVSHVVARAAQKVDWGSVAEVAGMKRAKISVTFEQFDRNATLSDVLAAMATSSASSTDTEVQQFAGTFMTSIFARMTSWLADAGNGIAEIFAKTIRAENVYADAVHANRLCLEDLCVTKAELQQLLNQGGAAPAPTPEQPIEEPEVPAEDPQEEAADTSDEMPESPTEEPETPSPDESEASESTPETPSGEV